MRKKERKENALKFYRIFLNGNCHQAAIVAQRRESCNPNINKCQFLAVPSTLVYGESPLVIAESNFGIDGCFREFLDFLNDGYEPLEKKSYFDDDFNDWLNGIYGFTITYNDGFVFMLERK